MHITHLWRYPVKSFAGEPLDQAELDRGGIRLDRRYQIREEGGPRKGKPLTARQVANLLAYRASVVGNAVRVSAPDGSHHSVDDGLEQHLQRTLGRQLALETAPKPDVAYHDAHDLLVINASSVRALEREWGKPLDYRRFRPNIVLDGDDLAPYDENAWVGRSFALGDALVDGAALDERCVLTTIDPQSLELDPSFLRLIVERHGKCFGLYCRVRTAGSVAVGDEWIAHT